MSNRRLVFMVAGAILCAAGCSDFGKVEQGRVIGYNRKSGQVTLIRDSTGGQAAKASYDALPPISVKTPSDPEEMGPEPAAGKLMKVDLEKHDLVIFDSAANQFRNIPYQAIEQRGNVAKGTGLPVVDKVKKTITLYWPADKTVLTFSASDELLALPADTWKSGDVVRYYFKDPVQALRMMNVTRTDLTKS